MMRASSSSEAKKTALEAFSQPQDSQAILDALRAEFGVGSLASWPPTIDFKKPSFPAHAPETRSLQQASDAERDATPRGIAAKITFRTLHAIDDGNTTNTAPSEHSRPHDIANDVDARLNHASKRPPPVIDKKPAPPSGLGHRQPVRRMDASQQTPTQLNEDRDYTRFCGPTPTSPADNFTQASTNEEPRLMNADDTGAVDFGHLSELARPSSQVSEDRGFDNTRGEWRQPDDTSQLALNPVTTPYKAHGLAPVTPALPKNPFDAKNDGAVPFGGTQLFGQTQMPSSAVKLADPTSSRPSPNMLLNSNPTNIIETSPLKNRANVSSPTEIQTSSPAVNHEIPATVLRDNILFVNDAEKTPVPCRSQKDDRIPESPTEQTPRPSSGNYKPMAHYVPMKQSQERKLSNGETVSICQVPELNLGDQEDDDDTLRELERRKLVQKRRQMAAEEMGKVSFVRSRRRISDERPEAKQRRADSAANEGETRGINGRGGQSQPLERDSQKMVSVDSPSVQSTKATSEETSDVQGHILENDALVNADGEQEPADEEMIPATSPVRSSSAAHQREAQSASEPELPTLKIDEVRLDHTLDGSESPSLPSVRRTNRRTYGRRAYGAKRTRLAVVSSAEAENEPDAPRVRSEAVESLSVTTGNAAIFETVVEDNGALGSSLDESPVRKKTRSRRAKSKVQSPCVTAARTESPETMAKADEAPRSSHGEPPVQKGTRARPVEPRSTRVNQLASGPSSSLTNLSESPAPLSATTPLGSQQLEQADPSKVDSQGDSVRALRKRSRNAAGFNESPDPVSKAIRLSRRCSRISLGSTDELRRSPSLTAFDKDAICSTSGRLLRTSLDSTSKSRRLFDNMVFALTFSDQKMSRTKLEARITQAGGSIVHEGFQELFEPSPVMQSSTANTTFNEGDSMLTLTKARSQCGFAAVIADSHSRKAKYMQALALGLPCLAPQWIDMCLKRGEVVDWMPYLLCAGASMALGNAIRSRALLPYPASEAKLREVLEMRGKLLQGERLLIVMDHRRNETKQHYLFLALALAPSTTVRVSTVQQAGEAVRQAEQSGQAFRWIYVDNSPGKMKAVLAAAQVTDKKRRRPTAPETMIGQNLRMLTDERVIQSLILGRMVEPGETD